MLGEGILRVRFVVILSEAKDLWQGTSDGAVVSTLPQILRSFLPQDDTGGFLRTGLQNPLSRLRATGYTDHGWQEHSLDRAVQSE